jgi:hypothetical protein
MGAAFAVSAQSPDTTASAPALAASAPAPLPSAPRLSALSSAPNWAGLTPAQRTILGPLEPDWPKMGEERRGKWLAIANRISSLPLEDQARLQERMHDWAKLNAKARIDARLSFLSAMQLDAEQRRAKWEAYQALPPEKRAELAERAAKKKASAAAASPPKPSLSTVSKSNLVPQPLKLAPATAVAASLVQAKPGATTVLITRAIMPPAHQEAGQPKVIADPQLVDSKTLLPKPVKPAAAASAP